MNSNMSGIFIYDYPSYVVYVPGVVISSKDAPAIIDYTRNADNPIASLNFSQTFLKIEHAPIVDSYSARGPSFSYQGILKPGIMAPGVHVLAAWSPNTLAVQIGQNEFLSNDYNILSGASAACAHVGGVVAL